MKPSGVPVVVWQDNRSGSNQIHVLQWNGTAWTGLQGGSADVISTYGTSAISPKITIDSSGRAVVSFVSDGVTVVRHGPGGWQRVGLPFTSAGWDHSIAAGPDDRLSVSWTEPVSDKTEIYVRQWDGSSWTALASSATGGGISNSSTDSRAPAIADAGDGKLFVTWVEITPPANDTIFLKHWNGNAWVEYPDGSASGGGISNMTGNARLPSLAATLERVCISWEGTATTSTTTELFLRCTTR